MDNKERAKKIKKIANDDTLNDLSKRLKIGAIITSAFKEKGFDIILTGGSAVEYYTAGNYMTGDSDYYIRADADKEKIMHELGFIGENRNYRLDGQYIEFISTEYMGEKDRVIKQKTKYGNINIIGLEDILIDRINGTKFFDQVTPVYEEWALNLMFNNFNNLDWNYLKEKTKKESSYDTFKSLYSKTLKQRRNLAYTQAVESLNINKNNYSKEKDIEIFKHMLTNPLQIPAKEIRIILKEKSPYINNDLDAYNLERKIYGQIPIQKRNNKQKLKPKPKEKIKITDFKPKWEQINEKQWQCNYPNGYTAKINKLKEKTYIVSFGHNSIPNSKWKDIAGRHSLEEAKEWCNKRGLFQNKQIDDER